MMKYVVCSNNLMVWNKNSYCYQMVPISVLMISSNALKATSMSTSLLLRFSHPLLLPQLGKVYGISYKRMGFLNKPSPLIFLDKRQFLYRLRRWSC
ncbi:hypothetical protein PT2222_140076 [Paraburkholderia tropica]